MIGAIVGDIVGSAHEALAPKHTDFPLLEDMHTFTDDTVLSIAVADCLMNGGSYIDKFHEYVNAHPNRCYGAGFWQWIESGSREPYNSWGNGSAMRVSAVGYLRRTLGDVAQEAAKSASVTHNHDEGVKGAQATAVAIHLALAGESKDKIKDDIQHLYGYDLERTVEEIRPEYTFKVSCQETVPEAIIAFLDSESYEEAIRLAISLGGDADTLACIAGGIAEAFYGGVPDDIRKPALERLDPALRRVVDEFETHEMFHRHN